MYTSAIYKRLLANIKFQTKANNNFVLWSFLCAALRKAVKIVFCRYKNELTMLLKLMDPFTKQSTFTNC